MAEYRFYTLDRARRIVSRHEAVCTDDRHAFVVSTTLGEAGAEIEIWQSQRFVGLAARRPPPGGPHQVLVTTVEHHSAPRPPPRDAAGEAAGRPSAPPSIRPAEIDSWVGVSDRPDPTATSGA